MTACIGSEALVVAFALIVVTVIVALSVWDEYRERTR